MAIEVTMPRFGLTMHEGTVRRFFKAVGESVPAGERLFEVETEKVLYEAESPAGGVLAAVLVEEGATVECGGLVAVLAGPGEDPAQVRARYLVGGESGRSYALAAGAVPAGRAVAAATAAPAKEEFPCAASAGRHPASPVARKLAAERGLDLGRVEGTGPGGRITREDVERAVTSAPGKGGPAALAKTPPVGGDAHVPLVKVDAGARRTIPFRGMRKTIAERMRQSLSGSAQLTIMTEADVTAAAELHERLSRQFEFTYTDILIRAVSRALVEHPRMNARLEGDEIILLDEVNIGLAVALDEGLIVPVIRDTAAKSLREIAALARDVSAKARARELKLEDVGGSTFTITNLGPWGIDAFTPILNPGETGILGMGRIVEKPALYRGKITPRVMMTLSLTFDHRVIDGAPAAAFLRTVVGLFNCGEQ